MTHRFAVTVHYEDTDLGGHVYHANWLKFIERARSDLVRARGVDQRALAAAGTVFVVRRLTAEFLAPAGLDDRLTVETEVTKLGGASAVLRQTVLRDRPLFRADVTLALVRGGRPLRLPPEIHTALSDDPLSARAARNILDPGAAIG